MSHLRVVISPLLKAAMKTNGVIHFWSPCISTYVMRKLTITMDMGAIVKTIYECILIDDINIRQSQEWVSLGLSVVPAGRGVLGKESQAFITIR